MIDNSGIDGVVQVFEKKEGGVHFIVSLNGLLPGDLYTAAVYTGSCAPNQPLVLETVGDSVPEDPFVSITESGLSFDMVTTGDQFVMIYGRELAEPALACGEVGGGPTAPTTKNKRQKRGAGITLTLSFACEETA
jgi:hypothetical protein